MTAGTPTEAVSATGPQTTLDEIARLASMSEQIIRSLRDATVDEDEAGHAPQARRYTPTEVAQMVGRSVDGIRKAERGGRLEGPALRENGRRERYTLAQINAMRDLWELRPGRGDDYGAVRLAFQNFKGGVAKSTLSCHCAQYLARAGYRVLLVDCDSQASTTMTFGYRPDTDLEDTDTLLPFLEGDRDDIAYAVRPTHWDGLDLVPANLELYAAEYYLASHGGNAGIGRLERGIASVAHAYDVVVIDPPPALGMISLSVLRALDGIVVPTAPKLYDFSSTASFLRMLEEVLDSIEQSTGRKVELDFTKIVLARHDPGRQAQEFVSTLMSEAFGPSLLRATLMQSAEIDNAASRWSTVYDLPGASSSRGTYKRCIESLDGVFAEVESLVQGVWQSRAGARALSNAAPARAPAPAAARAAADAAASFVAAARRAEPAVHL